MDGLASETDRLASSLLPPFQIHEILREAPRRLSLGVPSPSETT